MNNNLKYHIQHKTRGFVLPLVVIIMVIMVFMGFGMLSLGYNAKIQVLRQNEDTLAIAAAEAGITHAVVRMNSKLIDEQEWDNISLIALNISRTQLPATDARYEFNIVGSPSKGFVITSTGSCGSASRTFYALTLLRGVFDYGILVKDELKMHDKSSATAYDSKTGYTNLMTVLATASEDGKGSIDLNKAYVNGNVMVGPSGNPDKIIKNHGIITGKISAMESPAEFPEVSVPSGLIYMGSLTAGSGVANDGNVVSTATYVVSGECRYNEIKLEKNEILEISGNTTLHVTGDVVVKDNAQIRIKNDGNSSLTLYVDGKFKVTNKAIINNLTQKPENFKLFGSAPDKQDIIIETDREPYNFYGVVYAPNAKVTLKVKGDLYGSFVCDKFELKSESVFYHDRSVTKDINQEGVYFGIGRWYEQ